MKLVCPEQVRHTEPNEMIHAIEMHRDKQAVRQVGEVPLVRQVPTHGLEQLRYGGLFVEPGRSRVPERLYFFVVELRVKPHDLLDISRIESLFKFASDVAKELFVLGH
jgi:hypothetical protein